MNLIEPALFILFFAILAVPVSMRFHLPLEIFLVIGSGILSLNSWLPAVHLKPEVVFNFLLPPILFYAAYFTSWRDFKFNFRPISSLAIGLVVFTMLVVAIVAKWLLPAFTWAECFLLGAVVSPTDATAATSIIKKLGSTRRLISILEGESMVNDAMALILFRFSLAVILGGSFSFSFAAMNFVLVTLGGIISGLLVSMIAIYLLPKIHSDTAETTLTFVTAFMCYFLSERLGVSGIIATVVGGIYCGIYFPEVASSLTKMNAKASWSTLLFIINGFAFTLIGLELPFIVKNLQVDSLITFIFYGLIISTIVIISRLLWVYPMTYLPRLFFPTLTLAEPSPSWKIIFLVGWSGMRGIVSLAAALSIPFVLYSGVDFPHRDLIIFITYCVIVITLIVPTITLPIILNKFNLPREEYNLNQESMARVRTVENSIEHIKRIAVNENIPNEIINDFQKQLDRRLKIIKTQLNEKPYSTLTDEYMIIKKLILTTIHSERVTLLELRKSGDIHDEIFHRLSYELDLEEMRTKTLRI